MCLDRWFFFKEGMKLLIFEQDAYVKYLHSHLQLRQAGLRRVITQDLILTGDKKENPRNIRTFKNGNKNGYEEHTTWVLGLLKNLND